MQSMTVETYKYDELSEEAKEKALETMQDINTDYEWWDSAIEDAKEIGRIMGIEISNIYFSGFSSQGDGAFFKGEYAYRKNSVKELIEYAPADEELHRIVKELRIVQGRDFYQLSANAKQTGYYYDAEIAVSREDYKEMSKNAEESLKELLTDFMHWIYRTLEKEYEYLTSKEAIEETIRANEYKFTEDGSRNIYL